MAEITGFTDDELDVVLADASVFYATDELNEIIGFTEAPSQAEALRLTTLGAFLYRVDSELDRLETLRKRLAQAKFWLEHEGVPQYAKNIKQDKIGLPEFNVDIEVRPWYKANIAADWDEASREAAFAHLDDIGGGDIIRSAVSASVGAGDHEKAKELAEAVAMLMEQMELNGSVSHQKTVPWNTLTAFVKNYLKTHTKETDKPIDLKKLGAQVGEIALIKHRKEN